ncbi:MAG: hypothetical protein ACRC9R_04720 [Enterovibrio sp.]
MDLQLIVKNIILVLLLIFSFPVYAKDFKFSYADESLKIEERNPAIVAVGLGINRIRAGEATGIYFSGLAPIGHSDIGVYGRGELISDKYKTGNFWSINTAIGIGYYFNDSAIVYTSFGKCFSNYSTCYFNSRQIDVNDDDIDAFYFGAGTFIKEKIWGNYIEVALDWSPYQGYNGRALYLGYGIKF